jgi:hypothetical protein
VRVDLPARRQPAEAGAHVHRAHGARDIGGAGEAAAVGDV